MTAAAAGEGRRDAVLGTVRRLWPESEVAPLARRDRPCPGDLVLVAAPDLRSPRLLVPDAPGAAARSMLRFSAALGAREVAERLAMAGALAAGAGRFLPDRIVVRGGAAAGIAGELAAVLGHPLHLSLGIGTARINSKPVLGIFGPRGRPVGYAKVGDSEVAAGLVRAETAALQQVGGRSWRVLEVPRVLHAGAHDGMALLVMSALAAPPWQPPSGRVRPPCAAMDELARAFDGGRSALAGTPWWSRCVAVADGLLGTWAGGGEDLGARRLRAALDALEDRHGDDRVRIGAWHGDLTAWNLARRGRRVQLWDWERFETGVPVGLDRVHFELASLPRVPAPAELDARLRSLVDAAAVDRAAVGAYLAAVSARYLLGAREAADGVVAARTAPVLGALERWVGAAGGDGATAGG